ncbi:aspartate/glutamate racemase family protein [Anaerocolumna sp. MB42-C2]|uniref:aspartate/glutamate racemase family protein n=1 Tax=Anaerocolumna sp. MB42-C2 TaxID=3070997 RepID=UPI0027DECDE5|nr:aspartate/glutamate racemase family protein [Anaerocolumna sp. MB42-C2]WMJ87597.1 aspartate/glutamate racemase family protein [Anaerocolumna sp. MB42-C2]
MNKNLSGKTLGIIHASHITIGAMEPYIQKYIPEVDIMHLCDDTIQRDNIRAGAGMIPKVNYYKFAQYAHNLEEAKVDLILLACSTFNYAAELGRPLVNVPIAQIDRPMMETAVRHGKKIGLLATLATTVPSSERLLQIAAKEAGKEIEFKTVLCSRAFEELSKGNTAAHNEILLDAVQKLSDETDCIVMAQLSMSALAPFLADTKVPVYNSGDTGFDRVRQLLENR